MDRVLLGLTPSTKSHAGSVDLRETVEGVLKH